MSVAKDRPLVSVVVVSYQSRRFLEDCFNAVFDSTYSPLEVVMFDNASSDGGVEFVRSAFPAVRIIESGSNVGFARACNSAIRSARGEYAFLLNPDTVVARDCIETLVREMEAAPRAAVCGAKLLLGWEPGLINSVGHNVNRIFIGWDRGCFEPDGGQYDRVAASPSVCGGAALYRKSVFNELGCFDRRLYMYSEDVDFGLRANLAGYRVLVVPRARVYHWIDIRMENPRHHEFQEHRYRLRILLKSCPRDVLPARLREALLFDMGSIRRWLRGGEYRRAYYRLLALLWNIAVLPCTLAERVKVQRKRKVDTQSFMNLFIDRGGYPFFGAPVPDYEFARDDRVSAEDLPPAFAVGAEEEKCLGLGWHGRSALDGRPCRRMGLYGILYLGNRGGERCRLRLRLHGGRGTVVRARLNNARSGSVFVLESEGWQFVDLPAEPEGGLVKLFLSVDDTRRPVAVGEASLLPEGPGVE